MKTLRIKPIIDLKFKYDNRLNYTEDSGLDLFVQEEIICPPNKVTFIGHSISCELVNIRVKYSCDNFAQSDFIYTEYEYDTTKSKFTNFINKLLFTKFPIWEPDKIDLYEDKFNTKFKNDRSEEITYHPYLLAPRSSMSKTPLIMANSIGIIDKTYRGELIGAVYNTSKKEYIVKSGSRLFQIILPNLESFDVQLVTELSNTPRGTSGFGSTGK